MRNKEFPDELKLADVTPIYKKYDHNKSKNYRSVNVLPLFSKVFEIFMHKQMSQDVNRFLVPFLCGYYRRGFSTEKGLLSLINKWKFVLHSKG